MTQLEGKKALVTGASTGIGRAIAVAFAQEGAYVGIHYSSNINGAEETLRLVKKHGGDGKIFQKDLSKTDEIGKFVLQVIENLGRIDILVNNSGIGAARSADCVTKILQEDWEHVTAVNFTAPAMLAKHVIHDMLPRNKGAIINISSIRGLLGNPNLAAYSSTKGGLVIQTKQLAADYSKFGIRVNCICPGFVHTEMFASYLSKQEDPEYAEKVFSAMSPMNRIGKPEEIARVAVFFASDRSSFITGTALPVDGGYTASGDRDVL